jgi:hypothetical protein
MTSQAILIEQVYVYSSTPGFYWLYVVGDQNGTLNIGTVTDEVPKVCSRALTDTYFLTGVGGQCYDLHVMKERPSLQVQGSDWLRWKQFPEGELRCWLEEGVYDAKSEEVLRCFFALVDAMRSGLSA